MHVNEHYTVHGYGIPIGQVSHDRLVALMASRKGVRCYWPGFRRFACGMGKGIARMVVIGTCLTILSALCMTLNPAGYIGFLLNAGFVPYDAVSQKWLSLMPFVLGLLAAVFWQGLCLISRPHRHAEDLIAAEFGCERVVLVPQSSRQSVNDKHAIASNH